MLKIAVISDIHANMQALEAVLEDIKKEKCDEIWCLGDVAVSGPEPVRTLEFVRKQNWIIIQGNTDLILGDYSKELGDEIKRLYPIVGMAIEDDYKLVSDEDKKFLRELPPTLSLEREGLKILMTHGSPRSNSENIFPNMPMSEIEKIIRDVDADIILCGHTHTPCGYQTDNRKTVINAGSVGRSMVEGEKACYLLLSLDNKALEAKHQFVPYDNKKAAKLVAARAFEGADKLANLLIDPTSRHV